MSFKETTVYMSDLRQEFAELLAAGRFVTDKTGCKMIEVAPAAFLADEESIFGAVNRDYVRREIEWYDSMSLSVDDIPGGAPEAWRRCAGEGGLINSNYGWMIGSAENFSQYASVLAELRRNPQSRRACMIYTRPSMQVDYCAGGRSDFCCTWGHTYHVRHDRLQVVVNMRSNDGWAGYRNDYAWARHVQERLALDLGVPAGPVHWRADSLHFYEAQFYLVHHYAMTGESAVAKKAYRELYPDSPWSK